MSEPIGPRSLELFFIDGRPDGMLTAEVFNWTGHVLLAPRTRLQAVLARPEARFTGVYLLLGESDGEPTAYIGEAEDMAERIRTHDLTRDWWTQVAFITTSANALNKAHVRYLEARMIAEARKAARSRLDNRTNPPPTSLSEAGRANMEAFLAYLFMVLSAIRVELFETGRRPAEATTLPATLPELPASVVAFELESRKHGLRAIAHLIGGEFVVQKGSRAQLTWVGNETRRPDTYIARHAEVVASGVLRPDGPSGVFVEDFAFRSPAEAAAVILGRLAASQEWREATTGRTYRDWEAAQLAPVAEAVA